MRLHYFQPAPLLLLEQQGVEGAGEVGLNKFEYLDGEKGVHMH